MANSPENSAVADNQEILPKNAAADVYGLPLNKSSGSRLAVAILLIFVLLYGIFTAAFYVPAHLGVDQNGYMLTARLLAEHGRLSFLLHNPLQFAGSMVIQTPQGNMYAKYPPGVGVLGAILRLIAGPAAMYLVDPICTLLAIFGAYFIFRRLLDPFLALSGVILLAINPVTLTYANDANSQGAALGFTVLGFWALLSWWQKGGNLRAVAAGVLLGFCCWLRYTEFLWILPLLAVVRLRYKSTHSWSRSLIPIVAFALPVSILAIINWRAFGAPWRTGYWFCREQTGFSISYLVFGAHIFPTRQGNWLTVVEQFENMGLFLLFPMALLALCKLPVVYRRFGTVVLLWVAPSTLVYALYYWAPTNADTVGYLRFFLDTFPALIMVSLWMISEWLMPALRLRALAVGGLCILAAGYSLHVMMPRLQAASAEKLALLQARRVLRKSLRPGSVVFAPANVCNYLNSVGGFTLYDTNLFTPAMENRMTVLSARAGPSGLQKTRAREYRHLLSRKLRSGRREPMPGYMLHQLELRIIRKAWSRGKQVAFLSPALQLTGALPTAQFLKARRIAVVDQPAIGGRPFAAQLHWMKMNPRLRARLRRIQARRRLMRQWDIVELIPEKALSRARLASAAASP